MSDADIRLIAESATAFATGQGGPAKARRHEREGGLDRDCWRAMAELGWFAIAVPEEAGGLGLGAPAACGVAQAAGGALMTAPLVTAMAVASLLSTSTEAAAREALAALLAGSQHLAFARAETDARGGLASRQLADLDFADGVVIALGVGSDFDARLVRNGSAGTMLAHQRCVDGSSLGRLRIERSAWGEAPRVLAGAPGEAAWQGAVDLARLLDAASLCGLTGSALDMALAYLRLRRQFGVAIGSFQALAHRAVDCHVRRSAAAALMGEAARAHGAPRSAWAAAAAVRVAARAALHVAKENIQFHGAIGFADEHDAGLYLRRAVVTAARHA